MDKLNKRTVTRILLLRQSVYVRPKPMDSIIHFVKTPTLLLALLISGTSGMVRTGPHVLICGSFLVFEKHILIFLGKPTAGSCLAPVNHVRTSSSCTVPTSWSTSTCALPAVILNESNSNLLMSRSNFYF